MEELKNRDISMIAPETAPVVCWGIGQDEKNDDAEEKIFLSVSWDNHIFLLLYQEVENFAGKGYTIEK